MPLRSTLIRKGVSFLTVFLLTAFSWVLLGYLVRLLFPAVPLSVFMLIGLASGLLIATLLAFMHEETVPAPHAVADPEKDTPPPPDPTPPGFRPNAGSDSSP